MAEELPSLHIDNDWKKQAQEEKRRLAEEQEKRAAAPATTSAPGLAGAGPAPAGANRKTGRDLPPASFASLVQSVLSQALFYLGDLAVSGAEPMVNLDMAKHQVDLLGVLEEKTQGNLADEEKRLIEAALYESRMRFVSVASQYI